MTVRWAVLAFLATTAVVDARCGNRAGDDEAIARALDVVATVCPCDGGWRGCVRRHVVAAAPRVGLRPRCRARVLRAARRRGCVTTSTSTSTSTSSSTTTTTLLRKGLPGRWRLDGQVTENQCNASPDFDTVLEIAEDDVFSLPLFSLRAEGEGHVYFGGVDGDRWWLTSDWSGLSECPTGEPGEPYWQFAGLRPDAETVIPVTATLTWFGPTAISNPCPECAVRWEGTMRRE